MDNEAMYGKRAFTLNFGQAVERKIICPYKVLVTIVTNQMVSNELLDRGEVIIEGNAVNARVVANQIAIRKAINQYEPKKVFTFHKTVKSASDFTGDGS
jgi:predicted helicase